MARTLALPDLVDAPPETNPFLYGYRTVKRLRPDGGYEDLRLPLTLWDLLHPQFEDTILQSHRHTKEIRYLSSVLDARAARVPNTLVLSDTAIHWDIPGLSHHCPDVAVIFDVRRKQEDWSSFHVAREGVRPHLIIEVVSPNCRDNDRVTKLREYEAAMVPYYVIIDREKEESWPTLEGYHLTPTGYQPLVVDDRDCLLLPIFGLRLCVNQNRVILYDAQSGEEVGDYNAVSEALEAEIAAREAAEKKARLAEEQAQAAAVARQQAEEQAQAEAVARQQAQEQERLALAARQVAEEQARLAADRLQTEQAARADLERQVRELVARLGNSPAQ